MGGDESVHDALSTELRQLAYGASFTAVELGADGGSVWTVARDDIGTPTAERSAFPDPPDDGLDAFYARALKPLLGSRLALVACTTAGYPADLRAVLCDRHNVAAFDCQTPLKSLLRQVIKDSPLTVPYELVVFRQTPSGETDAGQLKLHSHPLFPRGASSGYPKEIQVRFAPTDEHGTVFAVVTRIPVTEGSAVDRPFRRIEVQSAIVPSGVHRLTAWLVGPGHTHFELAGVSIGLRPEARPWRQITRGFPDRLASPDPVHLICAIEVSGGADQVRDRISRLEEIITAADTGSRPLNVSVVSYGPHSVEPTIKEEPTARLTWSTSAGHAILALRRLRGRRPREHEYPRAAQLECALREIADNLTATRRTALVTIGSRPPHPPAVDLRTEIIPCGRRVSWRSELDRLQRKAPGLTFGALCDKGAIGEIWRYLGRDAIEEVEAVDALAFAERLGLRDPVQAVPFPLIEQRGT